jgi:hypothetical protein
MKKLSPSLILCLSVLFCPAYCQSQAQNSLVSKLPPGRGIRVTTGSVEVKGWEHGLVKRNPNLAHWHWDPLYSNTQAYLAAPQLHPRPGSHYINPTKVNTPRSPQSRYVKPIHVPFNIPAKENVSESVIARSLNNPEKESVQGNVVRSKNQADLVDKKINGKVLDKPSEYVATYGETYDKEIRVAEKHSSAKVYGRLKKDPRKKSF